MSDKSRTLAEQFVKGYRSKSEMDNWDDVIEIGLKLAQEVISDSNAPAARIAQSAPLKRDELVQRLKQSIPDFDKKFMLKGPAGVGKMDVPYDPAAYIKIEDLEAAVPIPNAEEIVLAGEGKFAAAVRSLCIRTGCTNKAGRAALEPYRKF